jgi:hypothetical protein
MNTATDQLEITSDNVFDGKRDVVVFIFFQMMSKMYRHILCQYVSKDDAPTFINDSLG